MYASLNDSYEWKQLNHNNALVEKIQDLLKNGERVGLDRIPTAMLQLKNKIKSVISTQMIDAVNEGRMLLIYSPNIKVPVYLPFIITRPSPHSIMGVVFLNVIGANCPDDKGEIFMDARKLKVSMESCYISMCIAQLGESPKLRSSALLRSGSKIYSGMVCECINRKHSLKLDTNIYNAVIYIISRYYIGTMLGFRTSMDKESMRNYCLYNCHNADVLEMDKIISQFEETDFDNIATLLNKFKEIPQLQHRVGKLTVANFLESFINMYNASALLGLETFNYFLYNVMSVNESTYVNNYPILKNIVGEDGKKIYSDLIVAVSNL